MLEGVDADMLGFDLARRLVIASEKHKAPLIRSLAFRAVRLNSLLRWVSCIY